MAKKKAKKEAKSEESAKPDKTNVVDAETLAAHLKVVLMKGRIEQVRFGENFAILVSDDDEEIAVSAKSTITFPHSFAVGDLKEFTKVVSHYKGEVKMTIDKERLVIDQGSLFYYQLADADSIPEPPPFTEHEAALIGDKPLTVNVSALAASELDGFRKLIEADIVQFEIVDGKVMARQISASTMHEAATVLGEVDGKILKDHERNMAEFKVSGAALRDVLDGVTLDDDDAIIFDFGKALRIKYEGGNYVFLVSPQVPVDGESSEAGEE